MAKITFYDFSSFHYASFFLSGFIENATERDYEFDRYLTPKPVIATVLDQIEAETAGE